MGSSNIVKEPLLKDADSIFNAAFTFKLIYLSIPDDCPEYSIAPIRIMSR